MLVAFRRCRIEKSWLCGVQWGGAGGLHLRRKCASGVSRLNLKIIFTNLYILASISQNGGTGWGPCKVRKVINYSEALRHLYFIAIRLLRHWQESSYDLLSNAPIHVETRRHISSLLSHITKCNSNLPSHPSRSSRSSYPLHRPPPLPRHLRH